MEFEHEVCELYGERMHKKSKKKFRGFVKDVAGCMGYDFKIEKAGSYVLTFRITDDAGNTTTRTLEFTVSEPSSAPVISTAVWGTVLIIVSLLILGGVIYFFIKPSKTKVKDTKTKSTKNEEKDKE